MGLPLHPIKNPFHGTDYREQSLLERTYELPDHRLQHRVLLARKQSNVPGAHVVFSLADEPPPRLLAMAKRPALERIGEALIRVAKL